MQKNSKWIGIALLGLALGLMAWQSNDQAARLKAYNAAQAKQAAVLAAEVAKKSAAATPVVVENKAEFKSAVASSTDAVATPALSVKPVKHLEAETFYTLENSLLKVIFTSRGGALRSVALKDYPATIGSKTPYVLTAPDTLPFLALNFTDRQDGTDLNNYKVIAQSADSITFARTVATGVVLERHYTLSTPLNDRTAAGYLISQKLSWHNVSANDLQLPPYTFNAGISLPEESDPQDIFMDFGSYNGKDAKFERLTYFKGSSFLFWNSPAKEIFETKGSTSWVSANSQFFSIVSSPKTSAAGMLANVVKTDGDKPKEAVATYLKFDGPLVSAGSTATSEVNSYFGPKEYARLASLPNHEDEIMQWGWAIFAFFSKMFISMLNWLAGLFHNYGVAIIALTLIIRALMWPFTAAAAQASKKMAAVQPMLKEVQTKYKDSPEKLQRETIRIFQENKVNPLAGCLPALLQIPVFIGFFYMLRTAAELRFESFLWIKDLSMPDTVAHIFGFPLNPLPLIMLVTMYFQIKLTPSSGDPEQQKIMQFTPFLFSFMLYGFSAGLTLYWTLSNVVSIIQQLMVNNEKLPPADSKGGKMGEVIDINGKLVK